MLELNRAGRVVDVPAPSLDDSSGSDAGHSLHGDSPVGREDDRLGRRPFAYLIARQIRVNRPTDGLVVAVVGRWGSGKTSVLRMVAEELADRPQDTTRSAAEVVVVEFNPWLFSGSEQLTALFFVTLADELSSKLGVARATVIAERLRGYGAALGTLRALPGIGGLFGAGADFAAEAARRLDRSPLDLAAQRAALAEALKALSIHLVVLIDDVDRLQSATEIRDLMRMVKLVGDLPGVTYVLSYDRRPVVAALKSKGISGEEYLEKIVQLEHTLPEVTRDRLSAMLIEEINSALNGIPDERVDTDRSPEVLERIIKPLVTTPRHVRRYANALRLTLDVHGEEVDLVDQLALTALATFVPAFHHRLSGMADLLFGRAGSWSILSQDKVREQSKARLDEAAAASGAPEIATAVYELLFPQTSHVLRGIVVGPFSQRDAQRRRRVADPDAFWTYVTAALPEAGVTVADVRTTLDAIKDESALTALLESRSLDELSPLFERLRAHASEVDAAHVPAAARAIASYVQKSSGWARGRFDDPARRITWFVVDLVAELPESERHKFLTGWAADESELSAKLAVYEIGRYKTDHGERLIGDDNLANLQANLAQLVCATDAQDLLSMSDVGRLLWLTGDSLERTGGLEALHGLLEDDHIFVRYLLIFTEPSFDDGPRPLAWRGLQDSLGSDWLINRVERVASDIDLSDKVELTPGVGSEELTEVLATARGFVAEERTASEGQDQIAAAPGTDPESLTPSS